MTAIIDYGVGNLFSLALLPRRHRRGGRGHRGTRTRYRRQTASYSRASGLLRTRTPELCADRHGRGRAPTRPRAGKPVLGICLGMQLLFERSFEYGEHPGLGLLKGEVVGMEGRVPSGLPIPHIGWNALRIKRRRRRAQVRERGRLRLFCPQLLRRGLRGQPHRHGGVRRGADRRGGRAATSTAASSTPKRAASVGLGILRAFCELEG